MTLDQRIRSRETYFGDNWSVVRQLYESQSSIVYEVARNNHPELRSSAMKAVEIKPVAADGTPLSENECRMSLSNALGEVHIMYNNRENDHILKYLDHCEFPVTDDAGTVIGYDLLIRTELLPTLDRWLRNNGRITERLVIRLGQDILQAMKLCHSQNVVHNAIDPESIFVAGMGFKLGNFSRAVFADGSRVSTAGHESLLNTSPETYRGESPSRLSDLYSLGLVLHSLMNDNLPPFITRNSSLREYKTAILRRIKGETLTAPVNAGKALAQVILRACAFEPANRYESAEAMLDALNSIR